METTTNPWDALADRYAQWVAPRDQAGVAGNHIIARLLEILGDVTGQAVLDAGCGEGFLARIFAGRGASVTGIDLSPRLIEIARQKDHAHTIDYRHADLSRPLPEYEARFDAIGSYLALNDVADYRGFATTLASLAKPGGRIALAFNNPYSFLLRGEGHITNYFASDSRGTYGGLTRDLGAPIQYYYRTMEEYLDAFSGAGLRLAKYADVPRRLPLSSPDQLPMYVILAFDKP